MTTEQAIRQLATTARGGMVAIYQARHLTDYSPTFDRDLRSLVIAGVVSCESQHGRLPQEYRDGGYRDGSTLMVWVSLV